MKRRAYRDSEHGQTLVIVVIVMILALTIGVTVSNRFISNLRTQVKVDSSYRAQAVAEALVDRLLVLPDSTLEDFVTYGNCGSTCTLTITGADNVVSTAQATLTTLGNSSASIEVPLSTTDSVEFNLNGYGNNQQLWVCWQSLAGVSAAEQPSVVLLHLYGSTGNYSTQSYAANTIGSSNTNNFSAAVAAQSYQNCIQVSGVSDPKALRMRSLYNNVDVFVVPASGQSLPSQGIQITSTGTVLNAKKKVTVVKSRPYLPVDFDFTLYSKSLASPLTNAAE